MKASTSHRSANKLDTRHRDLSTIDLRSSYVNGNNLNKIGRNAPCPCGNGKKYKRCHGQHAKALAAAPVPLSSDSGQISHIFRELEAKRIQQERQQGFGKPIISAEFNGHRFVAVRDKLHYSDKWKTFHDFLADYMKLVFGKTWWLSWVEKPREELHPVLLWANLMYDQQLAIQKDPDKVQTTEATGAMSAYMSLSYDLYCLAHNVELQTKMVERLKHADQFWGARYEVFAAAVLLRSGFTVEFENEDDRSSTHCEFTATHKTTGRAFSVEAKHRAGSQFRFGRQLNRALKKNAKHERIVFMDVNMPSTSLVDRTAQNPLLHALKDVRLFETRLVEGKELPPAYLVITNSPHHHHLASADFQSGALLEGFRIPDFKYDATYPSVRAAVESKERHRELHELGTSLMDHSQVPSTFDGEIPEFAFGEAEQRLFVGRLYEVSLDGVNRIGRLTSATVNEHERAAYCAYHFEDTDDSAIFIQPLSEAELSAWRRHPDTFFGVPGQRQRQARDPVELYEFFLNSYSKTDKAKLLEIMADAPDVEALRQLDQPALAREYSIRLASAAHAQS